MAVHSRAEAKAKALKAIQDQARGKVAVCTSCSKWFANYQDRNTHRATCPKRIACQNKK